MSVSTTTADMAKNREDDGCTCLNKSLSRAADLRLEEDIVGQNSAVKNVREKLSPINNESFSAPKLQTTSVTDGNESERKVLDSLPRYIQILLEFIGIQSDEILKLCKINDELVSQLNEAAKRLHQIEKSSEIGKSFVSELKASFQEFEHFKICKGHEKMIAIARKKIKEEMKSLENCQQEQPQCFFEIPLSSYDDRSHNNCF